MSIGTLIVTERLDAETVRTTAKTTNYDSAHHPWNDLAFYPAAAAACQEKINALAALLDKESAGRAKSLAAHAVANAILESFSKQAAADFRENWNSIERDFKALPSEVQETFTKLALDAIARSQSGKVA